MTPRFPSRSLAWPVALGLLLTMALLAGCGKKDGAAGGKRDSRGDAGADTAARNNNLMDLNTPSTKPHPEGEFVATWPSGCARIRTRTVPSSAGDGRDAVVRAECYRDGDASHGCSVSVWFERPDGGPLSVEDVTAAVARGIGDRRLQIVRQTPVRRDGMEGVLALCREEGGTRCAWYEGYLHRGRMLVVTAWSAQDDLFEDPETRDFFRSVTLTY
ncbi:MAG: hypothetical protein IPH09_10570 [bacterium]|nr:hypothetical protein [bacterium]